jgi:hypothetical protein
MGRLCTVCTHPQRDAINAALLANTSGYRCGYRAVAGRFGLAPTSVQPHYDNCLRRTLKEANMRVNADVLRARAEATNLSPDELEPRIASRLQDRAVSWVYGMRGPDYRRSDVRAAGSGEGIVNRGLTSSASDW